MLMRGKNRLHHRENGGWSRVQRQPTHCAGNIQEVGTAFV
jgi:hypothetical protein